MTYWQVKNQGKEQHVQSDTRFYFHKMSVRIYNRCMHICKIISEKSEEMLRAFPCRSDVGLTKKEVSLLTVFFSSFPKTVLKNAAWKLYIIVSIIYA